MASARSRCGAWATRSSRRPSTTFPRAPTRTSRRSTSSPRCSAIRRPAGCTRRSSSPRKPAACSVSTSSWREPTIAMLAAEVRIGSSLDAARDALLETIEGLTATPPTKDEVERARDAAAQDHRAEAQPARTDRPRRSSECIGAGDWRLFFLHRDRLRKVTTDDVAPRRGRSYLKPSNRTLGLFIPTEAAGSRRDPGDAGPRRAAQGLQGRRGDRRRARLRPVAGEHRKTHQRANAAPAGLKLALLPKKTRGGDRHRAAGAALWQRDRASRQSAPRRALAGAMLMRGTVKTTRQQIQDEFDRLKARLNVGGSGTQATASVETTRDNLAPVLRLAGRSAARARVPGERVRAAQAGAARRHRAAEEPSRRRSHSRRSTRHLGPYPKGDVRYTRTPRRADRGHARPPRWSEVQQFHRDFYGASNGELAVVGDFDEKEIASWPTNCSAPGRRRSRSRASRRSFTDAAPANQSLRDAGQGQRVLRRRLESRIRDDHADYPALLLGNYMLGGGFLNSRLASRIRQKDGLSYGVGSGTHGELARRVRTIHRDGDLCAAERRETRGRLQGRNRSACSRMASPRMKWRRPRAATCSRGRSVVLRTTSWRARLNNYLFLDRTLDWDAELENKIKALTPEQINAAMQRHINQTRMTIMKAGDFGPKR